MTDTQTQQHTIIAWLEDKPSVLNRVTGLSTVQDPSALTGRIGLVWLAPGGFAPYVNYSQSFQPTLGIDRAGNAFDPVRGEQTTRVVLTYDTWHLEHHAWYLNAKVERLLGPAVEPGKRAGGKGCGCGAGGCCSG